MGQRPQVTLKYISNWLNIEVSNAGVFVLRGKLIYNLWLVGHYVFNQILVL